jgi:Cu(I)/Ag(I) efflux system membrane protein CusA/SilA
MKPLATPVLGGMVSSLLHVLVITPVLFFWIRERRLGLEQEQPAAPGAAAPRSGLAWAKAGLAVALLAITGAVMAWSTLGQRQLNRALDGIVVQTIRSGDLDIVVLSSSGALRQGRSAFTLEFRRAGTGALVDVGDVRASATMPMPGMVMSGGLRVQRSEVAGRYHVTGDFGMAGGWQMALDWAGPGGRGSASFDGSVE